MTKYHYGKPKTRRLDLKEIEEWLPTIGFVPVKVTQEWRHVIVFGTYEGKKCVLKLATTQTTSRYTYNEKNWNDAVWSVDPASHSHFTVPHVYASGTWNKLFYFIADWFEGKPLMRLQSWDEAKAREWLPTVAAVTREIETLPLSLSCDFVTMQMKHAPGRKLAVGDKLLLAATEWASLVPRDLDPLLKCLEREKDHIRTAPAHGDFVL
ncbi:hypothetical protein C5B42_00655 [Candidatus Cerribacteria bacterium 'Amazon FNV 2010 28 9']|uniref:Aminoglycoside phosphotransferase domain-containing protein n=1 Tax=Candidatus Cerribacteria bacterium 'Amazon FNV 2010 28 9' TaxID=2081795 RepID=A0A317JQX4_9BACT|nr:MAG: hypothetical protein C5B42_00655 [Candidatus Cerribacteria bacterium 'Amazon FNV 2010 28 9']